MLAASYLGVLNLIDKLLGACHIAIQQFGHAVMFKYFSSNVSYPCTAGAEFVSDPNNLDSFQLSVQKKYNRAAASLAFLVAMIYTAVGLLRLGFLMRFLSMPIVAGFTTGASMLIGVAQVGLGFWVGLGFRVGH